jgi:hypothetical protein
MALSQGEKFMYGLRVKESNQHSAENRPLFDQSGYCHGYVVRIEFHEARAGDNGRTYGPSYKWELVCRGTVRVFGRIIWTWTRKRLPTSEETQSAFMSLCQRLGLAPEQTPPLLDSDVDLSKGLGLKVSYKLVRKGGKYVIDEDSIQLDTDYPEQLEWYEHP